MVKLQCKGRVKNYQKIWGRGAEVQLRKCSPYHSHYLVTARYVSFFGLILIKFYWSLLVLPQFILPLYLALSLSPPPPLSSSLSVHIRLNIRGMYHISSTMNRFLYFWIQVSCSPVKFIFILLAITNVSCLITILIYNRYYTLAQYMNDPKICTPCLFTTNDFFFTIVWYCASMPDPSFRTCTFGGLFSTNNGC